MNIVQYSKQVIYRLLKQKLSYHFRLNYSTCKRSSTMMLQNKSRFFVRFSSATAGKRRLWITYAMLLMLLIIKEVLISAADLFQLSKFSKRILLLFVILFVSKHHSLKGGFFLTVMSATDIAIFSSVRFATATSGWNFQKNGTVTKPDQIDEPSFFHGSQQPNNIPQQQPQDGTDFDMILINLEKNPKSLLSSYKSDLPPRSKVEDRYSISQQKAIIKDLFNLMQVPKRRLEYKENQKSARNTPKVGSMGKEFDTTYYETTCSDKKCKRPQKMWNKRLLHRRSPNHIKHRSMKFEEEQDNEEEQTRAPYDNLGLSPSMNNEQSLNEGFISAQTLFISQPTESVIQEEGNKKVSNAVDETQGSLTQIDDDEKTNSTSTIDSAQSKCPEDEAEADLSVFKILMAFLYILTFKFGIFGNSVVLYQVFKKLELATMDIFLANLALSDIMLCLSALPITPIYIIYHNTWPYGYYSCKVFTFAQSSSVYISTFTMILIAYVRYRLIVQQNKEPITRKAAIWMNVATWLLGFLVTLPYILHVGLYPEHCEYQFCAENWDSSWYMNQVRFSIITLMLQFTLPCSSVSFFYGSIFRKVKEQRRKRKAMQHQPRNNINNSNTPKVDRVSTKDYQLSNHISDDQEATIHAQTDPGPSGVQRKRKPGTLSLHEDSKPTSRNSSSSEEDSLLSPRNIHSSRSTNKTSVSAPTDDPAPALASSAEIISEWPQREETLENGDVGSVIVQLNSDANSIIKLPRNSKSQPQSSSPTAVSKTTDDGELISHSDDHLVNNIPDESKLVANLTSSQPILRNHPEVEDEEKVRSLVVDCDVTNGTLGSTRLSSTNSRIHRDNERYDPQQILSEKITLQPIKNACDQRKLKKTGESLKIGQSSSRFQKFMCRIKEQNKKSKTTIKLDVTQQTNEITALKERKQRGKDIRSRQLNCKLLCMVVLFALSWLPLNIFNIIQDCSERFSNWEYTKHLYFIAHLVACSSVCYNPILYVWMTDTYRQELRDLFGCWNKNDTGNHRNNRR